MSIHFSTKMRRTYRVFFILMALSMAGVPAFFKLFFEQGQSIAVVDGIVISPREYQEAVMKKDNQLAAIRKQFSGMNISDEMLRAFGVNTDTRESALDELITEKTISHVAGKLHIELNKDYVAQVLRNPQFIYQIFGDSIPYQLFNQNGIDMARFKEFLRRQGKTIASFDATIEEKLKQQLVLDLVKIAAAVSPSDIAEYTLKHEAPKTFTLTTISYAPYVKMFEKNHVSFEEMHAYFTKHNGMTHRYWSPESRSGTVWIFKQVADKERFMKEVQGLLSAPREAFASFAEQKHATSRSVSGEQDTSSSEVQALFALLQGRRTSYVKDGIGYVVELTAVEKAKALPFEEVKNKVMHDLYEEKARERVASILALMETEGGNGLLEGSLKTHTIKVAPGDETALASLKKQGVATERMENMFLAGQSFMASTETMGYRVVLSQVGSPVAAQEKKAAVIASLERENESRVAYDFIASLREHATIVMNKSLLKGM